MTDERSPPRRSNPDGTVPLTPPGAAGRSAQDKLIGQVLDARYRIRAVLGEGGMGKVYLAEDEKLNRRRVAVKLMSPLLTADPEFRARFQREALLQANLPHPQIVQVLDVGESSDGAFIVMEYTDGRSLSTLIRELGPRPLDRALDITEQLLEVLDFAHRQGVVHRDLKPSNLLVEDRAGREFVKVLDFGIAKLMIGDGSGESGLTLTKTGHSFGTLGYMAPEQARGESEAIDHRTDLYSVGVIMHEMLTGKVPSPPEARTHPVRYAMWVASNPIKAIRETHPDLGIPQEVDNLILNALRRDPVKRHASALAFLNAVREYRRQSQSPTARAGGPSVASRGSGSGEAAQLTSSRSVVPWLVAGLALVGGGAGWWMHWNSSPKPGQSADPELGRNLHAVEERLQKKERELAEAQGRTNDALEEKNRLAKELEQVKGSLTAAESAARQHQAELEQLRQSGSGSSSRVVELEKELGGLRENKGRLEEEKGQLAARLKSAEDSLQGAGDAAAKLYAAESALREAQEKLTKAEGAASAAAAGVAAAEDRSKKAEEETSKAKAESQRLNGLLSTKHGELETARTELARAGGNSSELAQLRSQVTSLQSEVTTLRSQSDAERSRADFNQGELDRLRGRSSAGTSQPIGPTIPTPPVSTGGTTSLTIANGFPDNLEISEILVTPASGASPVTIVPTMAEKDIPVGQSIKWTLNPPARMIKVKYRKWDRGNRRYFREVLEASYTLQQDAVNITISPER